MKVTLWPTAIVTLDGEAPLPVTVIVPPTGPTEPVDWEMIVMLEGPVDEPHPAVTNTAAAATAVAAA